MPIITNDHSRCEMLNLGTAPNGRGPFAIRQVGSPPGSMSLQEDPFLLRNDGVWVINLAVFSLPEEQQQCFFYATAADVIKALDNLSGQAVVKDSLPEGVSREQALAGCEAMASRLIRALNNAKPSPIS